MSAVSTVASGAQISEEMARSAVVKATAAYPPLFVSRYFTDERGQPVRIKPFHIEWLEAALDPAVRYLYIEAAATHGKSTVMSRWLPTILLSRDPNVRIMHIMQNATDAEQNLVAIQRQMEDPASLLVREHGPFRGRRWTTTAFDVARRTVIDKEPSFAAYGTGSNVFGHRADWVICDDVLNLENSGPHVTERQRQQIHDWFFQGVMKVADPAGKVVVIGTPMDFRDLYAELREARHGFRVLSYPAIVDEDTREVLWPERIPYEALVAMRESDPLAFAKRMQCQALDSSSLLFPQADLDACCDLDRGIGQKRIGRDDVVVAFDPSSGVKSGWCGLAVIAFDPSEPEPRTYDVLEIVSFRRPFESDDEGAPGQVETLIDTCLRYGARALVIERNGAHQYLLQSTKLRAFRDSGHVVEGHYTGERNKASPTVGLETLGPRIHAGRIRFPFGDEAAKAQTSSFFASEASRYPMAARTDRLMALWMAVLKAGALAARRPSVIHRPMPGWMPRASGFLNMVRR